MFKIHHEINGDDTAVWLTYCEGRPTAILHALVYYEGTAVALTPVMLVELRDAIQGVLDAMEVQEGEE